MPRRRHRRPTSRPTALLVALVLALGSTLLSVPVASAAPPGPPSSSPTPTAASASSTASGTAPSTAPGAQSAAPTAAPTTTARTDAPTAAPTAQARPSTSPEPSGPPSTTPTSTGRQQAASPTASPSTARSARSAAARRGAAADASTVNVVKRNSLGGKPLRPGQDLTYNLTVQCSSLTTDCVNQTFTDVLPADLDVTSLPGSTSTRTVTYDAPTRTLTIAFKVPLDDPPGTVGLAAGDTVSFEVGMRLPAETPVTTGTSIVNTATTVADNAPPKSSSSPVTVDVPRVVRPVATKAWSDGSAVAGTDEASTVTLGVRNASSTSAQVSALTVTDAQPATFEDFDLTGAAVGMYPAGADTALLLVCTVPRSACSDADYVAGPTTTGTDLALPAGVGAGQVTGVRVRFTSSTGAVLPYDATGGTVRLGLVLRDTVRSTAEPLRPEGKLTVANCASVAATDAVQGAVASPPACKGYDILPDTLNLTASKRFFADTNGSFANGPGEYAVVGARSRVSAVIDVKNASPFPVAEIVVREPGSGAGAAGNEFAKLDTDRVRMRYPAGATSAALVVTYSDGTRVASSPADGSAVDLVRPGLRVAGVELTYRGTDAAGEPSIAAGSSAGLDLTGRLNDAADADDLASGTSPGVVNCAGFEGSAGRPDGTGTAAGNACASLDLRERVTTSAGTKSVGQTSVPLGQPVPFALRVVNNGTLPLVDPVVSDPPTGDDGRPDASAPNPFDQLQITGASISKDAGTPNVVVELLDPTSDAWVSFDTASADVRERATGVRARMLGELTPTRSFTLNLVTQRRPGTPDGVAVLNCFTTSAGGAYTPGKPACAPRIQTGPVSQAASLNKSISPSELPREVPGVPDQYADVVLTVRNNGNLSMATLQATDDDAAFFDAVDLVDLKPVQLPRGANRVRIDAYVAGAWVDGTPATTPALPAGVAPATVRGVRATFSSTGTDNDGFLLVPCAPGDRSCEGKVTFRVSPRATLRSAPTRAVPTTLRDEAEGAFTTRLSPDPADPSPIPAVDASLTLTTGRPRLDVDKTPSSSIGPGETAPFTLTVTNNGTANIPQLLVVDALPKGLAFDDTFAGDGGQPFRVVNAQVPAGTDPVPTPTFTTVTDGERTSGLRFDFGGFVFRPGSTFQIQVQAGLEPGVTVGQTLVNTMGATSAVPLPGLECTAGDPVVTDGVLGEGTFCTHTATVTVKAGAAFSARKWVAGRDPLGWYDTRTGTRVALGARGCPSTVDAAGQRYTAYPCIALVSPGDTYRYLLRLTNAGTEPAREMRVVDRLPVQGDRGVILDQARGTDWSSRPTLAGEPVLDGASPGTLTNLYTDGAVCAADLDLDPADPGCAPSDWADPLSPATTGVQLRLAFPTLLAPGGSVAVRLAMTTPLDVARAGDPSIAWNSFAHAETTVRGGGTDNYLPPTEPVKTGVGLQYGTLAVTKVVGQNPSHLPLEQVQFAFTYRCSITPLGGAVTEVAQGDLVAVPGQTVLVPGLPGGATCRVWETETHGGVSSAPADDPAVVKIRPYLPGDADPLTAVTVTNDFPDAVISLRKVVTGAAAAYARAGYPVAVSCTFRGDPVAGFDPLLTQVHPGETTEVVKVPTGTECTVRETDTGQATAVTYEPAAPDGQDGSGVVRPLSGTPQDVTITNELRGGGLVIAKELVGPGAPSLSSGPFVFGVGCRFDGRTFALPDVTLVPSAGATTVSSAPFPRADGVYTLPVGSVCTVTETDGAGADSVPDPVTVTVPDEVDGVQQVVTAGLTNAFSAATLSVTKQVTGAGADAPWVRDATFRVAVTCEREDAAGVRTTVFSGTVGVRAGATAPALGADGEPVRLPLGSRCWGAETGTGGATTSTVDHDSYEDAAVVVASPDLQDLRIVATNTFDLTSLTFTKVVDGPGAGGAGGRTFVVNLTCLLDQGGPAATAVVDDAPFRVRAGASVTVPDLPVGASCHLRESDRGGAAATTVSADAHHPLTLGPAGATATVTNTFAATGSGDGGGPTGGGGSTGGSGSGSDGSSGTGTLAGTGAPGAALGVLLAGLVSCGAGAALLVVARRRRRALRG